MGFNLKDLVNAAIGKKPVKVKQHLRREPGGRTTVVDAYTKLIEKENEPEVTTDSDTTDEDLVANLDNPPDSVEETSSELDYADEDLPIDTTLSKNEQLALPKIKEAEIFPLLAKWQKNKDEDSMYQLLNYYGGIIYFNANKYKTGSIPYNLTVLEAKRLFIKAADTFDLKRGIKFNTHLTNYLKKLYRFVNDNTNIAKIPEQRIRKINAYKMALATLEDRLDREPTDAELSDELSWPIKELVRLRGELKRAEILEFGEDYSYGDLGINSPDVHNAIKSVYYDASKEEKFIIEHVTAIFGKPQLSITELSKKLKLPESKIKYLISNIKKKLIENV